MVGRLAWHSWRWNDELGAPLERVGNQVACLAGAKWLLASVNRVYWLQIGRAGRRVALEPEHQTNGIVVPVRRIASYPDSAAHWRLVEGGSCLLVGSGVVCGSIIGASNFFDGMDITISRVLLVSNVFFPFLRQY